MLGMTRRMQHYDVAAWRPWMIVAALGMAVLTIGVICQIMQLVVSIRNRESLRDRTGDPWDGRSLEWATSSPPPVFNFAFNPDVRGEDAYWDLKAHAKQQLLERDEPEYQDIEMPRNSPTGFVCAFFATIMGFALIWHIWWLVIVGGIGAFATFVVFAWRDHDEYVIPAAEVARDRPHQSRGTTPPRQHGGGGLMSMTATVGRAHADPHHIGLVIEHPGPALEAHRDRLRVLGLPALRHRDVLLLLCGLCGAGRPDRRRPEGLGDFRAAERRDRDRLPAVLKLHLRHGQYCGRRAQPVLVLSRHGSNLRARG